MPKPNVSHRSRQVGWWMGTSNGSVSNIGGGGQGHGSAPALTAGSQAVTFPIQVAHGLLGGAAIFQRGFVIPVTVEPTRGLDRSHSTHGVYLEISAHLRSAGNVDLPAQVNIFFNDYWPPDPAVIPNGAPYRSVQFPDAIIDQGDWVTGAWQEWEDFSPLTIPTPPPGFTSGGNGGIRYEYRRVLGRVPANFVWLKITNLGSVDATEWGFGVFLRSDPPVYTR